MSKTIAVAARVLRQLRHDRRFLILSIVAPLLVLYITKAALNSFNVPFINVSNFVIPIGAFVVHFATYVLCAIVLVRERTAQTLARMFVSGYTRGEIIGGYMLAYSCLATLQCLLVLGELYFLFHLSYPAPVLLSIYLVIWLLAVISISLGIFVSNFARTERPGLSVHSAGDRAGNFSLRRDFFRRSIPALDAMAKPRDAALLRE